MANIFLGYINKNHEVWNQEYMGFLCHWFYVGGGK